MLKIVDGCVILDEVILDEEEIQAVCKVQAVFDLILEINRVIKSMSEKEFRMLERSLEATKEEMESKR